MQKNSFNHLDLSAKLSLGLPVIFPTDTLPALGVLPEFARKLWEIKKRPLNKPLILMASNEDELFKYVLDGAREDAYAMAKKYWPGALTMVFPAAGEEVSSLNQNSNTIGMRVPGNSSAIELLIETGPLATTSANLSGEKPVLKPMEVIENFPQIPVLDPIKWQSPSGVASTVIAWNKPGEWTLLRRGDLLPDNIRD